MAHNISESNGRAELAYAGQTPWHGLGTKVDGLQTASDMLRHAGMLWTIEKQPMYLPSGNLVPSHVALVRQDNSKVLGVASERYMVIQNEQNGDIVDALVTEGSANVEVCGALGNGERCWMLARVPGEFEVTKGDLVNPYFLLAWGHDGKHGVAGKLTPVRVVCQNTLAAAGFGNGAKWKSSADVFIRHFGNPTLRIEEARLALGIIRKQVEETTETYRAMFNHKLDSHGSLDYFGSVFPTPTSVTDDEGIDAEKLERWNAHQNALVSLYDSGKGSEYARGTLWGAYNAITEWTDHVYPVLQSGKVSEVRQSSVAFGSYAGVKARAFDKALALLS